MTNQLEKQIGHNIENNRMMMICDDDVRVVGYESFSVHYSLQQVASD